MANFANPIVRFSRLFSKTLSLALMVVFIAPQTPPSPSNSIQNNTKPNSTTKNSRSQNHTSNASLTNGNTATNTTSPSQNQISKDPISLTVQSKVKTIEYSYSSYLTANTDVDQYQIKGNFYDPLLYELNKSGIYFDVPSRTSQLVFSFQDNNCIFPMICVTAGTRPNIKTEKNSMVSVTCDYSGALGILIRYFDNLLNLTNDFQLNLAIWNRV